MGTLNEIGIKAPDFSLPGVDGNVLSLSSLIPSKRVIAIIFMCNHCPYCLAYEGRLATMQSAYAKQNVTIVRINPDNEIEHPVDKMEEMKKLAAGKGADFIYLRDETGETAKAYGVTLLPTALVLDGEGKIRYAGRIDDHWPTPRKVKRHDLKLAIEDILHGRDIAVKVTKPVGCAIK
jgi:peroxiredoxin